MNRQLSKKLTCAAPLCKLPRNLASRQSRPKAAFLLSLHENVTLRSSGGKYKKNKNIDGQNFFIKSTLYTKHRANYRLFTLCYVHKASDGEVASQTQRLFSPSLGSYLPQPFDTSRLVNFPTSIKTKPCFFVRIGEDMRFIGYGPIKRRTF